jgi:hypothetical protein
MNMDYPIEGTQDHGEEQTLRSDIALFESHLASISANDDSAYEKARIRTYEALLHERRSQLQVLLAARHER